MNTHYVTRDLGRIYENMKFAIKLKENLINYIKNNFKEYALVSLLFVIGLFIGVMVINNCSEIQAEKISSYIQEFITKFKNVDNLDSTSLVIESIKDNVILAIVLWLAGTTVIGVPIVLVVILFRGVCLGYTISAIAYTLGTIKGILFCLISILLQNILFIPAILTLGVSSIKLYKSIIKDRRKETIKINIIKHTLISVFIIFVLIVSAIIENVISVSILQSFIKYF